MFTLLIDSSTAYCSVAIIDGDGKCDSINAKSSNCHSTVLFSLIRNLLGRHSIKYSDLQRIVVIIGPGSFTGIRAGIAAATGISLVTNVLAVGLSNLAVQAYRLMEGRDQCSQVKAITSGGACIYIQTFDSDILPLNQPKIIRSSDLLDNDLVAQSEIPITLNDYLNLILWRVQHKIPFEKMLPIYGNCEFIDL